MTISLQTKTLDYAEGKVTTYGLVHGIVPESFHKHIYIYKCSFLTTVQKVRVDLGQESRKDVITFLWRLVDIKVVSCVLMDTNCVTLFETK